MRPSRNSTLWSGLLGPLLFLFTGCRETESGKEMGLFPRWDDMELPFQGYDPSSGIQSILQRVFPELPIPPLRALVTDSSGNFPVVALLEYGTDFEAYAAFQSFATADELAEGFARRHESLLFRKGRWLGQVAAFSDSGLPWLSSHLTLPGDAGWGVIPEAFSSMVHQGRIQNSERVLTARFLGSPVSVPVFSVEINCRGDTAKIYASPSLRYDFGKRIEHFGFKMEKLGESWVLTPDSTGLGPIRLEFGPKGMVGVEGCFDSALTHQWLKSQKIALKSLKST